MRSWYNGYRYWYCGQEVCSGIIPVRTAGVPEFFEWIFVKSCQKSYLKKLYLVPYLPVPYWTLKITRNGETTTGNSLFVILRGRDDKNL